MILLEIYYGDLGASNISYKATKSGWNPTMSSTLSRIAHVTSFQISKCLFLKHETRVFMHFSQNSMNNKRQEISKLLHQNENKIHVQGEWQISSIWKPFTLLPFKKDFSAHFASRHHQLEGTAIEINGTHFHGNMLRVRMDIFREGNCSSSMVEQIFCTQTGSQG